MLRWAYVPHQQRASGWVTCFITGEWWTGEQAKASAFSAQVDQATPRAAMQTFLLAFRDWDGAGPQQAASTLDLSGVRPSLREHEGGLAAEYLKNVLARIGWVTLTEIPDDPNDRTPYVHFRHGAGAIVIAPQGEGAETRWRFTEETVRDLRALYAALEDMPTEP